MCPKHTPTLSSPTTEELERFGSKVHRTDSCWEWTGSKDGDGYGRFKYRGENRRTHRVAWFFAFGEWPTLFVCHRCDNPSCVNPAHLFLGTNAENLHDMAVKGMARPYRRDGEFHPNAKLTQDQVSLIRSGHFGDMSQREIANQLGVTQSQISRVRSGERWN